MALEVISRSAKETQALGEKMGCLACVGDVILLVGTLGAGKTCLTQGIAHGLGVTEYTASPSFVLVREYKGRLPLYHIDLYRLGNLDEIADLGLDDYFYGRGVTVVEWADRSVELLPCEHLRIELEYLSQNRRKLRFEPQGQRYEEMVGDLEQEIELQE